MGFTLIEIMVVVIVMAIVAGALAPNLGGTLQGLRLNAAARRIAEVMDYCHHAAVASGRVHGLVFAQDGVHYQVVAEADPKETAHGGAGTDAEVADEDGTSARLAPVRLPGPLENTLPQGIRLASLEADGGAGGAMGNTPGTKGTRILFFPDGASDFVTLGLETARGEGRSIRLNGLSGTVEIGTDEALHGPDHP